MPIRRTGLVVAVAASLLAGCGRVDDRLTVTIWHQSRPTEREFLAEEIARYEADHPGIHIRPLYKETEELRSGFQAASLAGGGPELVYGPSDVLDAFHTMGIVQDLSPWLPEAERAGFVEGGLTTLPARDGSGRRALVQIGDRFGNHLALVSEVCRIEVGARFRNGLFGHS